MGYKVIFVLPFFIFGICDAAILKNNNKISDEELNFPELKYINKNVDPCDNFYEYACGNFEKYNPRPENSPMWDAFQILSKKINNITIDILGSPARNYDSDAVRKAKDMYSACVNPSINFEQTLTPLNNVIEDIGGWPLIDHIPKNKKQNFWNVIGDLTVKYGLQFFFNFEVMTYVVDANLHGIRILRDSLKLPSTAVTLIEDLSEELMFLPDDKPTFSSRKERSPYIDYLINLTLKFIRTDLRDLYRENITNGITEVNDVLIKIKYANTYSFGKQYKNYTILTIGDLQQWSDLFSSNFTTRINWIAYFNHIYANTSIKVTAETGVSQIDTVSLANILYLVENTSIEVLMNVVVARLLTYMAPDTNLEMWEEFNNLYKNINYSVYSREEYCMRKITNHPNIGLSLAIAHEYQNYYFDVRKIDNPQEIIDNITEAFFELLKESEWLDDEARDWVYVKANAMVRLIAFPDTVYDSKQVDDYYKSLKVCLHDHFGNAQRMRAFNFFKSIENIDKKKDRYEWTYSPLYVNALYNQLNNRISFPAGVMNEPIFTGKSRLVDYSRIGALIGHEITHGFDTTGRNTDAEGNFISKPWSDEVEAAFSNRSHCFIEQYSKYFIDEINEFVNGEQTNPENIADNGGLREAFRAFQKLKKQSNISLQTDEYTADQLFFLSYATMWCKIDTNYSLETLHKLDNHAPNKFRVIGTLSNMKEFSETFNCPVGSNMNPESKCVLW